MNELDDQGEIALQLALKTKQDSMAENLVRHQANLNYADEQNRTLLHLAIERGKNRFESSRRRKKAKRLGDEHAATFLIKHACVLDHQTNVGRETPLHLLSSLRLKEISSHACRIAQLILEYGGDANQRDARGNSSLHRAILADNLRIFRELLKVPQLELNQRNHDDHVPLWLALQQAEQMRKNERRRKLDVMSFSR